eukprot:TRINITY_DN7577_c0_g1_i1.p1 TRINITY_DN7577_c0_g1~~TRINITY_DN7577_c0_g1_i1.p1  ORF type:complete len:385 (+),score=54.54 TRINITY_DN7577_c0_g1_i1:75-1157(+)
MKNWMSFCPLASIAVLLLAAASVNANCSVGQPCYVSKLNYFCSTFTACPSSQTSCSGTCTLASYDPQNCGTCGNLCAPSEYCNAGTCISGGEPEDDGCSQALLTCSGYLQEIQSQNAVQNQQANQLQIQLDSCNAQGPCDSQSLQDQLFGLQAANGDYNTAIGQLSSSIDALSGQLATKTAAVEQLTIDNAVLEASRDSLQVSIQTCQSDLDALSGNGGQSCDDLSAEIQSLLNLENQLTAERDALLQQQAEKQALLTILQPWQQSIVNARTSVPQVSSVFLSLCQRASAGQSVLDEYYSANEQYCPAPSVPDEIYVYRETVVQQGAASVEGLQGSLQLSSGLFNELVQQLQACQAAHGQ